MPSICIRDYDSSDTVQPISLIGAWQIRNEASGRADRAGGMRRARRGQAERRPNTRAQDKGRAPSPGRATTLTCRCRMDATAGPKCVSLPLCGGRGPRVSEGREGGRASVPPRNREPEWTVRDAPRRPSRVTAGRLTPSQLPRRASSTLPPGRPVGVMPSLRSTSLIASRVFWPTLPSGSPTS